MLISVIFCCLFLLLCCFQVVVADDVETAAPSGSESGKVKTKCSEVKVRNRDGGWKSKMVKLSKIY